MHTFYWIVTHHHPHHHHHHARSLLVPLLGTSTSPPSSLMHDHPSNSLIHLFHVMHCISLFECVFDVVVVHLSSLSARRPPFVRPLHSHTHSHTRPLHPIRLHILYLSFNHVNSYPLSLYFTFHSFRSLDSYTSHITSCEYPYQSISIIHWSSLSAVDTHKHTSEPKRTNTRSSTHTHVPPPH